MRVPIADSANTVSTSWGHLTTGSDRPADPHAPPLPDPRNTGTTEEAHAEGASYTQLEGHDPTITGRRGGYRGVAPQV